MLALVVVAGAAVSYGLAAQQSLQQAQRGLRDLRDQQDGGPGDVAPVLRDARGSVREAERYLDRLPVRLVALVPVLGRSFGAERAVTEVTAEVLDAAVLAAEQAPGMAGGAGQLDLSALTRLEQDLSAPVGRARLALVELERTPTGLTPPQVGAGVDDAVEVLSPAVQGLEDALIGLRVGRGLLGGAGSRNLLVGLANNAELRGSGGYVSSVATGRTQGGRLTLDPLRDVVTFADPPARARRVPAPPEYVEDYGPLAGDTTQFRSWNMSPDFPATAVVGARVAGMLLGTEPDVVVLLDVPAMTALAALGEGDLAVGGGRTVSPAELQQSLLVDSYAEAGTDDQAQDARRVQLQAAASVAVGRLLASDVPVLDTVRTLGGLARGRHLSVWSARTQEQADLVELGLAGAVRAAPGEDLLHMAVNNIGANKLDVYVKRAVELEAVVGENAADVVQRLRLSNQAPADLVPYVAGFERPGTMVGLVEVSLPPGADVQSVSRDGATLAPTVRRGADRLRLRTRVELDRGQQTVLEVRYRVPLVDGAYRLRALPQPLAEDATMRLDVRAAPGVRLQRAEGTALAGGAVVEQGPFTDSHVLSLRPRPDSWGDRLRQFWYEPVRLG